MTSKAETKFKEVVIRDLKALPHCWFFKTQERARRGIPDIIACLKGDFVAIELKTDDGVLDKLQERVLFEMRMVGGISFVATPSTWRLQYESLCSTYGVLEKYDA